MVPVQLRVGGAFLGIALVLLIYATLGYFGADTTFVITPQVLTVLAAVALVGAYATTNTTSSGSRAQVYALLVAVVLIGLGIILPNTPLMITTPVWLAAWAVAAGLCAIILRRSIRKPPRGVSLSRPARCPLPPQLSRGRGL